MRKNLVKVIVIDLLLLASLILVVQDLQWRSAYAASPHPACINPTTQLPLVCSFHSTLNFGVLTQVLTMDGNGYHLVSPPYFSWTEILVIALLAFNIWFVWKGDKQPFDDSRQASGKSKTDANLSEPRRRP